jgi:hypothetical protein
MAQEKETKQLTVTELTNELQRLFALKPDSYDNTFNSHCLGFFLASEPILACFDDSGLSLI